MQKVIRVCDLHEDEVVAVSRLDYSLDGKRVALDLCADHLASLRQMLDGFSPRASDDPETSSARVPGSRRDMSSQREEIRSWARENGFRVADKGRVAAGVITAFEAAHRRSASR